MQNPSAGMLVFRIADASQPVGVRSLANVRGLTVQRSPNVPVRTLRAFCTYDWNKRSR